MNNTVEVKDPISGNIYEVPGHWADVADTPKELDDGRVLVQSDMRADPVEGVQGTYTVVNPDWDCPKCEIGGVHTAVHTLSGVSNVYCPHCGWSE